MSPCTLLCFTAYASIAKRHLQVEPPPWGSICGHTIWNSINGSLTWEFIPIQEVAVIPPAMRTVTTPSELTTQDRPGSTEMQKMSPNMLHQQQMLRNYHRHQHHSKSSSPVSIIPTSGSCLISSTKRYSRVATTVHMETSLYLYFGPMRKGPPSDEEKEVKTAITKKSFSRNPSFPDEEHSESYEDLKISPEAKKPPKGRLDTLMAHIIRKCPALDRLEKQPAIAVPILYSSPDNQSASVSQPSTFGNVYSTLAMHRKIERFPVTVYLALIKYFYASYEKVKAPPVLSKADTYASVFQLHAIKNQQLQEQEHRWSGKPSKGPGKTSTVWKNNIMAAVREHRPSDSVDCQFSSFRFLGGKSRYRDLGRLLEDGSTGRLEAARPADDLGWIDDLRSPLTNTMARTKAALNENISDPDLGRMQHSDITAIKLKWGNGLRGLWDQIENNPAESQATENCDIGMLRAFAKEDRAWNGLYGNISTPAFLRLKWENGWRGLWAQIENNPAESQATENCDIGMLRAFAKEDRAWNRLYGNINTPAFQRLPPAGAGQKRGFGLLYADWSM
ncbi:hypothetical protein NHQ30_003352 [Ciborinia camelliae]|nr:hypothetical protein NHQ30_003352 [Ciborinia camelliae]